MKSCSLMMFIMESLCRLLTGLTKRDTLFLNGLMSPILCLHMM